MESLTDKQERFCQEYLIDSNATQAAIRAGYSEKTAQEQSSRLLLNVMVQNRIQELQSARAKRTEITADFVLKELYKLASVDLSQAYDEKGNLKSIHDMPEECRKAIAGIKVYEEFDGVGRDREKIGETREIKLWDKTKALEMLGKHLKLFVERHEHTFTNTLSDKLDKARKRRKGNE